MFIIVTGVYSAVDFLNRHYPAQLILSDKIPSFNLWQWTAIWLAIAVFVIFRGAFCFAADLRKEIIDLQTPNISVEFFELRSKHGLEQLFITIKNLSRVPVRAEVWCTDYQVTKKDEKELIHTALHVQHFVANQFTVTSEEPHYPSVLDLYKKNALFGPIKVAVPNKRQYDMEALYGDEFKVTFTVYGGVRAVSISFRCAIKDGELWAEPIEETASTSTCIAPQAAVMGLLTFSGYGASVQE